MRRRPNNRKVHQTTVEGVTMRGFADQIITKCEGLGCQAQREKDHRAAHRFFQTADHFKRVKDEENNVATTTTTTTEQ